MSSSEWSRWLWERVQKWARCLFSSATDPFSLCFSLTLPHPDPTPPSSGGKTSLLFAPPHLRRRWRRRRVAANPTPRVSPCRRCGCTTPWVRRRSSSNPKWIPKWECTCAASPLMILAILDTLAYTSISTFFTGFSILFTHISFNSTIPSFSSLVFLFCSVWQLGRYFKHLGFEVCYVRNFTDVDDKVSHCLFSVYSVPLCTFQF